MYSLEEVRKVDPEIASLIEEEVARQNDHIELIASENWTSKAVMSAMGSPLTNKYAEGLPGKRYYGGCYVVDKVENIARDRAKELFHCDYVNVQPHSGAQANLAVQLVLSAQAVQPVCGAYRRGRPRGSQGKIRVTDRMRDLRQIAHSAFYIRTEQKA